MSIYRVIYEKASDGSWSVSATDLPVFSAGATREEAEREIRQAISIYLEELANTDELPPTPSCVTGTVTV
jgi:predicted RNase H-like HicB family nuclease